MVQALILAHGDLARALLATVEALAGPQPGVRALSNEGCALPQIVERIQAAAGGMAPGPLVLFTDLLGGSCANAARAALRGHADWHLVTGVSVPMLINFFQNRDRLPLTEVLDLLVERAREGVQRYPGP